MHTTKLVEIKILNETNASCAVAYIPEIHDVANPSKVLFFSETLIFFRANHGHGDHGKGGRRGVFGDGLSKKMSARDPGSSFQ